MLRMISRAALLVASVSASVAMAASLNFENLKVRAMPPGSANSAGYMVVENPSHHHSHALVAVESNVANMVELHTHGMKDGVMSMHQVHEVVVPAGEKVMFQPGGYHIMLMGLKRTLKVGETVDFTMVLKNGERVAVTAPIVAPEDIKKSAHQMHMSSSDDSMADMHKGHTSEDEDAHKHH